MLASGSQGTTSLRKRRNHATERDPDCRAGRSPQLRERLVDIEAEIDAYEAGDGEAVARLRRRGTTLLAALASHMTWEETYLFPRLRDADAWAPARVKELTAEHLEQRARLAQELEMLTNPLRTPAMVVESLRDFVAACCATTWTKRNAPS